MKDTVRNIVNGGREWVGDLQRKAKARAQAQQELFDGCQRGDPSAIMAAMARGASLSAKTADGFTPLHLVVMSKSAEALNAVLDGKPNLEAKNKHGLRPLHVAAWADNEYAAARLIASGSKLEPYSDEFLTPLMLAAKHGRMRVARTLISLSPDVNTSGLGGETALHYAARHNHVAMAQLLIEKGASINATGEILGTPLEEAKKVEAREVVSFMDGSKRSAVEAEELEALIPKARPAPQRGSSLSL